MQSTSENAPSTFAQLIDKLRTKSEEELKVLYTRMLSDELKEEWKNITTSFDSGNSSEKEMIDAIQHSRYKGKYV